MNRFRSYRKPNNKNASPREEDFDMEEELEEKSGQLDDFPSGEALEISEVEQLTRPRYHYRLFFGDLKLRVHEDVMIKYRMLKGSSFTREELEEIMEANERQSAYASSINLLSFRSRTRTEIMRKLREKEFHPHVIEVTLERLEQEKLIDDGVYAQQWANQRVRSQKKGKVWIRQELRQKGVEPQHIEEALGNIDEDEELSSAVQLAEKKWRSTPGGMLDKKRKTMAFLMRRGYSSDLVRKALAAVQNKDQEEEDV